MLNLTFVRLVSIRLWLLNRRSLALNLIHMMGCWGYPITPIPQYLLHSVSVAKFDEFFCVILFLKRHISSYGGVSFSRFRVFLLMLNRSQDVKNCIYIKTPT